jgi:hypothetical protein
VSTPISELFVSVSADVSQAVSALVSLETQLNKTTRAFTQAAPAAQSLEAAGGPLNGMLQLVGSGVSLVGEAVGGIAATVGTATAALVTLGSVGLVGFGTSSFLAAARVSELDGTLRALAQANGLNIVTLQGAAQGIQSMGIEAASARQVTALLVQNQLDLSKSTLLARTAQDAAVISGQNSTQTLDQLVHGIVTLNTEVIRNAGITVDVDRAERNYAAALGITFAQLTPNQKQTAVLNAVLEAGTHIAGAYATAMEEPGKVLRSLPRVVNDLQVAFGERLLPEFGPLIIATFELVKDMGRLSAEGQPLGIIFTAIGTALAGLTGPLLEVIGRFHEWFAALQPEDIQNIVKVIQDFSGALGPLLAFIITVGAQALPIVGKLVAGFNPFAVALGVFALQSQTFRDFLGSLLGTIVNFIQTADFSKWGKLLSQVLEGDVTGAFGTIRSLIGDISPEVDSFFDSLGGFFGRLGTILDNIRSSGLGTSIGNAFGVIGTIFQALIEGRGGELIEFFKASLPQAFKDLGAAVEGPVGKAFQFIGTIFSAIINGDGGLVLDFFRDQLPEPLKALGHVLEGPVATAFSALGTIFGAVLSGHGGEVLDFFKASLPQAFKDLGAAIEGPVGAVFGGLGTIFGLLLAGRGQEALDFFEKSLPDAFKTLGGAIEGPVGTVFSAIGTIFQAIITGNGQLVLDFFSALLPQALKDFGAKVDPGAGLGILIQSLSSLVTAVASVDPAKVIAVGQAFGVNFLGSFQSLGTQLQPLIPVFQSLGAFFGSVAEVVTAFDQLRSRGQAGGAAEDPLISPLQRLANFVKDNLDLGNNTLLLFGPMGKALQEIAVGGANTATFFRDLSDALHQFSVAVHELPRLPDWLEKTISGDVLGGAQAAGGDIAASAGGRPGAPVFGPGGLFHPTAFGGQGSGGNVIITGPVNIGSEVDAESFLQRMAGLVSDAAKRVNTPPDNSGFPQLAAGVI